MRRRYLIAAVVALMFTASLPAVAWFQTTTTTASVTPGVVLGSNTAITTGSAKTISVRLPANLTAIDYATGTGAQQVDLVWSDTRTYAATPTTFDLSNLVAATTNTGAATFNNVKVLAVYNNSATDPLIVGNAASAQFVGPLSPATATITIQPGCGFVFYHRGATGWDSATAKNLKIDPAAKSVSATIAIGGED